jgi:hypothetical protein
VNSILLNKETFREFHTEQDANEWAINNFGQWIKLKEN